MLLIFLLRGAGGGWHDWDWGNCSPQGKIGGGGGVKLLHVSCILSYVTEIVIIILTTSLLYPEGSAAFILLHLTNLYIKSFI